MTESSSVPAPTARLAASGIPIALLRQTLIWPLALHLRDRSGDEHALRQAVSRTIDGIVHPRREHDSKWRPVNDPSKHIAPPREVSTAADKPAYLDAFAKWHADRFTEGVYFHEFIQSFLFSARDEFAPGALDQAPFRLFRRDDIHAVDIKLGDGKCVRLSVERMNLYVFQTGAAILVVEVSTQGQADQGLMLSDAQNLLERFRRAYVPYAFFKDGKRPMRPPDDLVVRQVIWRSHGASGGGDRAHDVDRQSVQDMVAHYLDRLEHDPSSKISRRFAPIFPHWVELLPTVLRPAPYADDTGGATEPGAVPRWHQVVDERIPVIATISVTAPGPGDDLGYFRGTAPDELVRLCYADGAGRGAAHLYDVANLEQFWAEHGYTAFREKGTQFLCSGYAFVAYGAGWFFDHVVSPVHMRRHYFQIGLLAHFELATLLGFSSRISRAVTEFDPARDPPESFERTIKVIEGEYLQYLHRFRFTGVSNHLQAQQLTTLWRRQLRLQEIFDDLHGEITSAAEYLFNRAASRGAGTAERLQIIGMFGLVVGLTFTLFGANLHDYGSWWGALLRSATDKIGVPGGPAPSGLHVLRPLATLSMVLLLFSSLGFIGLVGLRRLERDKPVITRPRRMRLGDRAASTEDRIIGMLGLATLVLAVAWIALTALWALSPGGAFQ